MTAFCRGKEGKNWNGRISIKKQKSLWNSTAKAAFSTSITRKKKGRGSLTDFALLNAR
jgi:hypothetical protein